MVFPYIYSPIYIHTGTKYVMCVTYEMVIKFMFMLQCTPVVQTTPLNYSSKQGQPYLNSNFSILAICLKHSF